jgi:hypothetical protein
MAGLVMEGLAKDAEHGAEIAELHEARRDRERQPGRDQPVDEDIAPQDVVQEIQHDTHSQVWQRVLLGGRSGRRRSRPVTQLPRSSAEGPTA